MNVKNILSLLVLLQMIALPVMNVQAAPTLTAEQQAELEVKKAEAEESAAAAKDTAVEVAKEQGIEFSDLQDKLVAALDKAASAIDQAIVAINASSYLSKETKVELTDGLTALEGKLLDYRTKVNNASTLEELETINKEVVSLLKANKTVIGTAMKESGLVIAEQVSQSIEKMKIKAEKALQVLDVECDSAAFAQIETLVTQLETTNASLKVAIKAKDLETAKVQAKAAIKLSSDLAKVFSTLVTDCQDEIEELAS